jgi:hypothetical protein
MFCIEHKIVHVGAEKIITLYFQQVTSNLKILALLLMMQKITLEVKFDEKYVHLLKIYHKIQVSVWRIGNFSGWRSREHWFEPSL